MRKYRAIFRASLIRNLNYRGPQIIWAFCSLLSVVTLIALWTSANSGPTMASYTRNQLITYAIISLAATAFINFNPFPGTKRQIKDGSFATDFMLKPVSPLIQRFLQEAAWRLLYLGYNIISLLLAVVIFRNYLSFPLGSSHISLIILTIAGSALLQFTFSSCLAMLAFWFTEVESLNSLKWLALSILGGTLLPISFIPESLQYLVKILPFRYMFSLPLEIYFKKVTLGETYFGLLIQVIWIFVFLIIYRLLYLNGTKRYVSVGQ